jgi:hypothetical protein
MGAGYMIHSIHQIRIHRFLSLVALIASGTMMGCDGGSFNPRLAVSRAPTDLDILQLDSTPVLVSDSVSFWAVRGEDRSAEIFFADSLGQPAERLLRFEVNDNSLDKYPDGSKFRSDDSVYITIKITDPATLAFDFEPSGLRFKKDHPAKLTVAYGRAGNQPAPSMSRPHHDHDDDGEENGLGIWMQEQANGDFVRLKSRVNAILEEVTGDVPGFSRYAIAY